MHNDLNPNFYFKNKEDAVAQLIDTLPIELLSNNKTVVISISQEGVYFADKIANVLSSQADILLSSPIMAPNNNEVPIAMISETQEVVMHKALVDAFEINEDYVYSESHRKYEEEILAHVYKYRRGKKIVSLEGKYVVLVDESIETSLTMMLALKSVIARGAKNIYIATPILDKTVYQNLLSVSDGVFCPHKIQDYISIEYYYENFEKLSFEEIDKIIEARIEYVERKKLNEDQIRQL